MWYFKNGVSLFVIFRCFLKLQGDNPFKFYVLNDIFRYQDDVFNDGTHHEQTEEGKHGKLVIVAELHLPATHQATLLCYFLTVMEAVGINF